jgi:peptidase E
MGLKNKRALKNLMEQPLSKISCGVIKNPVDLKPKEKRKHYNKLIDNAFELFELDKTDIDLRKYKGNPNKLEEVINNLDFLWITGGNVFYLRELIKEVEMENMLIRAIKDGLVYGGDSAGALITCPTLKYLDWVDDTSEIEEVIYKGLGIIDFVPLPHWDN